MCIRDRRCKQRGRLGGPRFSKMETQTPKIRCWKTSSFQHRFLKGSDVVFEAFLVGFSIRKCMPKTRNLILVKTSKIVIFLWANHDFQEIEDTEKNQIRTKIDGKLYVFWNFDFKRILDAFWDGFGKALGGQNPQKPPKTDKRLSKSHQESPRNAQERKMSSTCPPGKYEY